MQEDYYEYRKTLAGEIRELRRALPGPMRGFGELHRQALSDDGALGVKEKELIALGIAIAVQCEGCITLHVKAALDAGATPEEILESIGVAILMGGGPAMVYGLSARRALEHLSEQPVPHPG